MATAVSVPNTFVNNTTADGPAVSDNFAALVAWINANAAHLDASKAFTGIPSGPATDPTSANQFARKAYVDKVLPVGTVFDFAGSSAPTGTMVCDGSAVSRSTYSALFGVIGTLWGAGDGSTTFNLPDLRGSMTVGLKTSDTDFDTVGKTGGQKTVQAHVHGNTHGHLGSTTAVAGHMHGAGTLVFSGNTNTDGAHVHTAKVKNVDQISAGAYSLTRLESANTWHDGYQTITPSGGTHYHAFSTSSATGSTAAGGGHDHPVTINNYTGDTASAGSGVTNMNPFAVVLKVIKF